MTAKPHYSPRIRQIIKAMQLGTSYMTHLDRPGEGFVTTVWPRSRKVHPRTHAALKRHRLIRLENKRDGLGRPMEGTRYRYWRLTRKGREV